MMNLDIKERSFAAEGIQLKHLLDVRDFMNHDTVTQIDKYNFAGRILEGEKDLADGFSKEEIIAKYGGQCLIGESKIQGNVLTNAGINLLWSLAVGGAGTTYAYANTAIAVGTGTSNPTDPTQTTLATETARVQVDASYPTYGTSQLVVFRSTFTGLVANVHWQEFGVFNNITSGGTMLNRKVSDQGTKTSGQTWQVSVTITLS